MCTRNVKIRKIRAVGLVKVVIGFSNWRVACCDQRQEECGRRKLCGLEIEVVEEGAEEANLL